MAEVSATRTGVEFDIEDKREEAAIILRQAVERLAKSDDWCGGNIMHCAEYLGLEDLKQAAQSLMEFPPNREPAPTERISQSLRAVAVRAIELEGSSFSIADKPELVKTIISFLSNPQVLSRLNDMDRASAEHELERIYDACAEIATSKHRIGVLTSEIWGELETRLRNTNALITRAEQITGDLSGPDGYLDVPSSDPILKGIDFFETEAEYNESPRLRNSKLHYQNHAFQPPESYGDQISCPRDGSPALLVGAYHTLPVIRYQGSDCFQLTANERAIPLSTYHRRLADEFSRYTVEEFALEFALNRIDDERGEIGRYEEKKNLLLGAMFDLSNHDARAAKLHQLISDSAENGGLRANALQLKASVESEFEETSGLRKVFPKNGITRLLGQVSYEDMPSYDKFVKAKALLENKEEELKLEVEEMRKSWKTVQGIYGQIEDLVNNENLYPPARIEELVKEYGEIVLRHDYIKDRKIKLESERADISSAQNSLDVYEETCKSGTVGCPRDVELWMLSARDLKALIVREIRNDSGYERVPLAERTARIAEQFARDVMQPFIDAYDLANPADSASNVPPGALGALESYRSTLVSGLSRLEREEPGVLEELSSKYVDLYDQIAERGIQRPSILGGGFVLGETELAESVHGSTVSANRSDLN